MRMVFEISSLKNATPATVSRAGILFINEADIGWRPMVESWVSLREDAAERNHLPGMFDKYIESLQEMTRRGYKEVTPCLIINKVSTIMFMMEGLLAKVPSDQKTQEVIENMSLRSWQRSGCLFHAIHGSLDACLSWRGWRDD